MRVAGYLHDAGKATEEVQARFRELGPLDGRTRPALGVAHKLEGAQLLTALIGNSRPHLALCGYLVSYGHHTGIPNKADSLSTEHLIQALNHEALTAPIAKLMSKLLDKDLDSLASTATLPDHVAAAASHGDLAPLDLFSRMCHSALVDADFLDTAAHFGSYELPFKTGVFGMQRWRDRFRESYAQRFAGAEPSEINAVRSRIFDACVRRAEERLPPGIYRLPAPTGSGKTMASAAFALHHAAAFGKDRVIVAVPFTTITTQNASAYRQAFGDMAPYLLEHHSNIIDDETAEGTWQRLSAPGWDAEFIVTTTVQLFESLFSNRPSQTRKLHRVANSVIVLDEVQALPIDLLAPILRMLRELVEHYGVTVLLASATQPTFWSLPVWDGLLVHDILPVDSFPPVTQRVTYDVRAQRQTWESIAAEAVAEAQVLLIQNTRADADSLFTLVESQRPAGESFLLSKSMTADHRDRVLAEVRRRLLDCQPVALVSTQLIEAGVDVDFPVVYRALAPAEAIVQAAGRCNREGRLPMQGGRVVVYELVDGGSPPGIYQAETEIARQMFMHADRNASNGSFDSPVDLSRYFEEVYRSTEVQRGNRQQLLDGHRQSLDFPGLAKDFRMIQDEVSVDVVVQDHPDPSVRFRIAEAIESIEAEPLNPLTREVRRLLQRHSASISRMDIELSQEVGQSIRVWCGTYDPQRGAVGGHGLTW